MHPSRLKLVLQDGHGVPFASRDVQSGQSTVEFSLPPVGVDQQFVVVASFQEGSGGQVVLAPFTVHVR